MDVTKQTKPEENDDLGPLPDNWEMAYTEKGEVYFIEWVLFLFFLVDIVYLTGWWDGLYGWVEHFSTLKLHWRYGLSRLPRDKRQFLHYWFTSLKYTVVLFFFNRLLDINILITASRAILSSFQSRAFLLCWVVQSLESSFCGQRGIGLSFANLREER